MPLLPPTLYDFAVLTTSLWATAFDTLMITVDLESIFITGSEGASAIFGEDITNAAPFTKLLSGCPTLT